MAAFSHDRKHRCTDQKYQKKAHKQADMLFIPFVRQNMENCCGKHMKKSQIFYPLIDFCPHVHNPPAMRIRNVSIQSTSAANSIRSKRAHPSPIVLNASTSLLSDTG